MKTKPFLLATAGSTVDGRTIDDAMLQQIASSYDPKTYGARLNIEHIRGVTGESPFRAYGDVVELSIGKTEVNFNGKKEQRTALFGTFDVTEDPKLNEAGQKVYPSIEIEPNFAGKGFAYLMGCALTDSPASIATQRLQFNRSLPGALTVAGETPEARICRRSRGKRPRPDRRSAALDRVASKFTPAPKTDPALGRSRPARRDRLRPAAPAVRKWAPASPRPWRICATNSAPRPMPGGQAPEARSHAGNHPRTDYRAAAADGRRRELCRDFLSRPARPHPVTTGPEHHGLQSFRSRAPGARRSLCRHRSSATMRRAASATSSRSIRRRNSGSRICSAKASASSSASTCRACAT
jgi:hypothetical protein